MVRIATGTQRRTFVVGRFAVKVPRLSRFRLGARANRMEARIWREGWQSLYPELCPVLASLPFGAALVMPAVEILSADDLDLYLAHGALPDHDPPPQLYEDKDGDWGLLDDRPVVVDYAMRAHMAVEDIDPRVRTLEAAKANCVPPRRLP